MYQITTSKHMKQKWKNLSKKKEFTVIVRILNIILFVRDRACTLNISKEIENLSSTQLIAICRTQSPTTSE